MEIRHTSSNSSFAARREEKLDLRFRYHAFGCSHHNLDQFIVGCIAFDAIDFKEDQCGFQSNPLVSVDKRVVQ
jgi:hypothetical protein